MSKARINYLTFLIGFSQIYAWATTYYLPATLIKILSTELGESYLAIVGGFSWSLLIGGLCAPRVGTWIDTEGGRRPLFLGSLLMGFGLMILAQTHGLFIWYLAWTIIGLGMALGLFNAVFAAVGRLLGQDAKKIIIRITLISGFATLFWPLTTYLIDAYGWRTTVLLFSLPHLIIWAPLYYFTIPKQIPEHPEEHSTNLLVVPHKVKLVFCLLAVYAMLRAIVGTTISVNILGMFEGLGITLVAASAIASLIGPSQIAGRILEMFFGRKFGPLYSSIFWAAVLPLAIVLLVAIGVTAAPIFAVAYGMSNGVLTITMGILPMIFFGSHGYAKLLGKLALPVLLAQAATPILVAPAMEHWTAIEVFILAAGLGVLALFCLIALPFITERAK